MNIPDKPEDLLRTVGSTSIGDTRTLTERELQEYESAKAAALETAMELFMETLKVPDDSPIMLGHTAYALIEGTARALGMMIGGLLASAFLKDEQGLRDLVSELQTLVQVPMAVEVKKGALMAHQKLHGKGA